LASDFDPVLGPEALARCACGVRDVHRPVLLERGIVRACMACGRVEALVTEWSYSDNPHADPEAGVTRSLTLDADTEAWLGAWPRVATGIAADAVGCWFVAPDVRVADAAALAREEQEAAREPLGTMRGRLRRAGLPPAPARRDLRFELGAYLDVYDALSLEASSPLGDVLAFVHNAVPLAARLAREELESRPQLGSALAERLAALVASPFDNEADISVILRLLAGLGARAAPARDVVRALGASELASARSTIRADVERILGAL